MNTTGPYLVKGTTLVAELGPRVCRSILEENHGWSDYRRLAIVLRWYDQFKQEKTDD